MAGCSHVRPDCADDTKKFLQSIKGIRRLADNPVGALACYAEIPLSLAHTERWKIWIKSHGSTKSVRTTRSGGNDNSIQSTYEILARLVRVTPALSKHAPNQQIHHATFCFIQRCHVASQTFFAWWYLSTSHTEPPRTVSIWSIFLFSWASLLL